VNSASWGSTSECPLCCHASSFQVCHVSPPLRKGRGANSGFGKDKLDENWPFTTSHKDIAVRIQPRPLSHVARSCKTTRNSQFLAPSDAAPHSTLRSPSKSRADYERTQTPDSHNNLFSTSCCAPHPRGRATESPCLWQRTAASVTSFAMARLPRACHTP
jgi:hypothetical protein